MIKPLIIGAKGNIVIILFLKKLILFLTFVCAGGGLFQFDIGGDGLVVA